MVATRTVIAVNRFGLGARPGELQRAEADSRAWLLSQLQDTFPEPSELRDLPDSASALVELQKLFDQLKAVRQIGQSDKAAARDFQQQQKEIQEQLRDIYTSQATARIKAAANSERPFYERLTHFWANHFAVSADKQITRTLAATLENEAVRPHVHGYFADMLLAVEQHPAMITYLDNHMSIGPNSRAARWVKRRRGQELGFNENLAREILELHTLGVNGGYTQGDVTTFAKVITGWTVAGIRGPFKDGNPGHFMFRDQMHEPGSKKVLGRRYTDDGEGQGVAVLKDLAEHSSTARFVATKLVRHFISDSPPAAAVDDVANAFLDSNGYLPTVYESLIDRPEAWDPPAPKFKTPQDFVISTFRALDFTPTKMEHALGPLRILGQLPYMPGSPAGWPDTAADWAGSDAVMKRIEWSVAVGDKVGNRSHPLRVAEATIGPLLSEHSRLAVKRAASPSQGLALLLVCPEFQRR